VYYQKSSFYITSILFTLLLTVFSQPILSSAEEEEDYLPYELPFDGLFMKYPSNWKIIDENLQEQLLVEFVLEDHSNQVFGSMAVMNIELNRESSAVEVADTIVQQIKDIHNDLILQQEIDLKIDGYPTAQKIVSYTSVAGQAKQDIVVTVVDNTAHVFLFSSLNNDYEKHHPIFDEFLNSIEITPETIPQFIDLAYEDEKIKGQFPKY
jgi:hypothetical protein